MRVQKIAYLIFPTNKEFLYFVLLNNEIFGILLVLFLHFFFRLQTLPKYILLENVKGFEVSSAR